MEKFSFSDVFWLFELSKMFAVEYQGLLLVCIIPMDVPVDLTFIICFECFDTLISRLHPWFAMSARSSA